MSVIRVLNRTNDVTRRYHLTDEWPNRRAPIDDPGRLYSVRLGRKENPVYGCGVLAFFKQEPGELDDATPLAAAQRNLAAFLRECCYADWLRKHRIPLDGSLTGQRRRYVRKATMPHGRCRKGYCVEHALDSSVESCS